MQGLLFPHSRPGHIRASRTTEASKTIAATMVCSRLDFCNSLLAGTSVSNLTRLQRVQNTLARVVTQKPIFHPGHFSFKIQTGTYLTPAKKTWFNKIGSRKFQADIQSEYHWQNPWASSPSTHLSTHFQNLPVFLRYSLLIGNFIPLRLPSLN